ncbi:MAG: hypothetical protein GWN46_17230, partial [Gammaproteobacteria bacterium]|nr:hypothetical protein [Gammaproteobacteria bacterium]
MIDFELSDNEKQILAEVREQALVARKYARHYDENEHEFPPDELPEAEDYPDILGLLSQLGESDSHEAVMSMLLAVERTWGDYSLQMHRPVGGLGNSALLAAGTPEQQQKWRDLTLAMA